MSRKVRKTGKYSGLREDGSPWPEMLIGIKNIACYLRTHPATISKWIGEGLLPTAKDAKGRRWTTRSAIDQLFLETYKAEMDLKRTIKRIQESLKTTRISFVVLESWGADRDGNGERGIVDV